MFARLRALPVLAAAAILLITPQLSLANTRSNTVYGTYVTQTLSVSYNTSTCNGGVAYQMTSLSATWVRSSSYATVTGEWLASEFGSPCSGTNAISDSGTMNPSSWVNNQATAYHSLANWPLIIPSGDPNLVTGAQLTGKVMYRNRFNQYICTWVHFAGVAGCVA